MGTGPPLLQIFRAGTQCRPSQKGYFAACPRAVPGQKMYIIVTSYFNTRYSGEPGEGGSPGVGGRAPGSGREPGIDGGGFPRVLIPGGN